VGSDEFDERNASAKVEGDDHPKIASGDFKTGAFAIQNFCIWRSEPDLIHRIPFGCSDQRSPTVKWRLRFRMLFGVRRKHAPGDNSHAEICSQNGNVAIATKQKRRGNNPAVRYAGITAG
jgi:hypothetical protein